ncbi:MAG: glycosyltransferase [Bdellovibrionales bacterium]
MSNANHLFPELSRSKISIIVPVFNEARNIVDNLDLLISEIEEYFPRFEILVVSDGSTDETNLRVFSFRHPDVKLIVVEKNMGKGHAVRSGFKRAVGEYILFIDGGMELHPREIKIFVGLMALYQADIVIGSKRHPQSNVDYPWYRKFLSLMFQIVIRNIFYVDVTDTQVGIKLFRRQVIDAILPHLEINRYGFDLELLCLARTFGYGKVLEAPVRLDYFDRNNRNLLKDLYHVLRVGFSLLGDTWALYRRLKRFNATEIKNEVKGGKTESAAQ